MAERKLLLHKVSNQRDLPLAEGELTIGRAEENRLRLTEGSPSRNHAKLVVAGGRVQLIDLGSTNGTFVNGSRLKPNEPVTLQPGSKLSFDVEEFEFRVEGEAADANKTMLRSPGEVLTRPNAVPAPSVAPAAPASVAPAPAPAPAATPAPAPMAVPVPAAASGAAAAARRPGSWVDSERQADNKTKFLTADDIARMQQAMPAPPPAPRIEGPHLIVSSGTLAGRSFALAANGSGKAEWTIGSDKEREIALADSGVSGLHAKLVYEERRWKLMDQMSANGTFVNDKRANISYLSSGDRLRFGHVECVIQLEGRGGLGALFGSREGAAVQREEAVQRTSASESAAATSNGPSPGLNRRTLIIGVVSFIITVVVVLALLRYLT